MASNRIDNGKLLAPNGKRSNLNATQYDLVRSKDFKDWFGDWENDPENSSQVVDENGEPLVVYRGYPKKRKFPSVFEYKYRMFPNSGVSGREKNEFAFYFTNLKEVAEKYGKNLADDEEYVIKQYFLNIRNLFEAFSYKNQYQITFKELYDLANKSGEPIYELNYDDEIKLFYQKNENGEYEMLPREWWEYDSFRSKYLFENTPNEIYAYFADWDKKSSNQFFWRIYLQRYLNYDGLVFYERTHNDELNPNRDEDDYYSVEKPWVLPKFGDEFSKTYGVFESNQIKLADGTNITFDKTNDDIRYGKGGLLAPNGNVSNLTSEQHKLVRSKSFKDWFGDWENNPENASKVVDENGEPLVVYHGTNVEFYEFDLKYFGKTDKGWYGKGFYFTPNRNFTFARDMVEQFGGKEVKLELFLNIKNPFYGEAYAEQNSNLVGSAKDMHRDGVIVLYDYGHELERQIAEIVVWESNQIKLADGTNTTFNKKNPDIRFEKGGVVSDNKRKGLTIFGIVVGIITLGQINSK
jgi:hypothetical protein